MDTSDQIRSLESRIMTLENVVGRLSLQFESSPIALVYPEPIATPLAKESSARLNHERFFCMLDAGEAFIQYTGAISVGLMKLSGTPLDIREAFKQSLPLGRWVTIIRRLIASRQAAAHPVADALITSLTQQNGRFTPSGRFFLEEFTNLRNLERGHASSRPDDAYRALHLRHSPVLHDSLDACGFLKFPLIRVESCDILTEDFSYDIRHLVGPPPLARSERIRSPAKLKLNSVYVWDRSDSFVDLCDVVSYQICEVCKEEHTFFLERISNSHYCYHSYLGNHRFSVDRGGV